MNSSYQTPVRQHAGQRPVRPAVGTLSGMPPFRTLPFLLHALALKSLTAVPDRIQRHAANAGESKPCLIIPNEEDLDTTIGRGRVYYAKRRLPTYRCEPGKAGLRS
jgi:hypothetical protein